MALDLALVTYAGPCWRAVSAGQEGSALDGTVRPGRYNRPGERTLYASGSPAGVTAAMARYGGVAGTVVALTVAADRLVDLRDAAWLAALGVDTTQVTQDWVEALAHGKEPSSWRASDAARALGAVGLIDASRRAPGEWHLVLFRWNVAGGARVVLPPTA